MKASFNLLALCGELLATLFSPPCYIEQDSRNSAIHRVVTELNVHESKGTAWTYHGRRAKLLFFSLMARLSRRVAGRLTRDRFVAALIEADVIIAGHASLLNSS